MTNVSQTHLKIGAALIVASVFATMSELALAYPGEKLEKSAHITMEQAKTIALSAQSGQITDEELEKENGGSGLRYSFDIKNGSQTFEVGVDANTGKVLENAAEGSNPD